MKANDEKLPYRLNVGFRAPCSDDKRLKAGTFFRAPFDRHAPPHPECRRVHVPAPAGADRREGLDARTQGEPAQVAGEYEGDFVVKRDGRRVATCETPVVRWHVTRWSAAELLLPFPADVTDP